MSKDTLEFHWGKHHRAYVDNLNKQIVGTELGDGKSLEDVVIASYNKGDLLPAFNNAGQVCICVCVCGNIESLYTYIHFLKVLVLLN